MVGPQDFAAFIITYQRSDILQGTIQSLLKQTYPPAEILIVDNSPDDVTERLIKKLNIPEVNYHQVGYNSGPAGGSKIGLELLTGKGYKWIYWGDDNDPPRDHRVFQRMIECIVQLQSEGKHVGVVAGKGAFINKITGKLHSLRNSDLKKAEIVEADYFPGNYTIFVNSEIVKMNIVPEERLFFSFEELDMCLKMQKTDYKIFIDAKTWLDVRRSYGNLEANYRSEVRSFGRSDLNWNRQYYSSRNLLYLYSKYGLWLPFLFNLFKTIIKIPVGFLYGINYGRKNGKIQFLALRDFFLNNYQNNLKVN